MSSNLKVIERNRENAKKSTGPKTPEGKRNSSQNARRLGLYVSDSTLESECPEEFGDLLAGYIRDYTPQGMIEEELVRQLAVSTLRLRRLERIETALLFSSEAPETRHQASSIMQGKFFQCGWKIELLLRARSQAERLFQRAYKTMEERLARRRWVAPKPQEVVIEMDSRHIPNTAPNRVRSFAVGKTQNEPSMDLDRQRSSGEN